MTRLGVNVPGHLLARLRPHKEVINVSQVCREALEERIVTYELASSRAHQDGMNSIAEKHAEEYERRDVDWEQLGYEDARGWAEAASYQNFDDLHHNLGILARQGRPRNFHCGPYIPGVKTFYDREGEFQGWFIWQIEQDIASNHHLRAEDAYFRAWYSYFDVVWKMIQDRIKQHTTARLEELSKQRKTVTLPKRVESEILGTSSKPHDP